MACDVFVIFLSWIWKHVWRSKIISVSSLHIVNMLYKADYYNDYIYYEMLYYPVRTLAKSDITLAIWMFIDLYAIYQLTRQLQCTDNCNWVLLSISHSSLRDSIYICDQCLLKHDVYIYLYISNTVDVQFIMLIHINHILHKKGLKRPLMTRKPRSRLRK